MRLLPIRMSQRGLVGLLTLTAVSGCGASSGDEPWQQQHEPILGGEVSPSEQDAVVAISGKEGSWLTGVVVAPTLVLTARHGVVGLAQESLNFRCNDRLRGVAIDHVEEPLALSVAVGNEYPFRKDAWYQVKHVYSGSSLDICTDDIALLQVDRPLPVEPLALRLTQDGSAAQPRAGDVGTLVGWGQTEDGLEGTAASNRLHGKRRQLTLTIGAIGPDALPISGGGSIKVLDSMFIAEQVAEKGACFGDSGGPFISNETGSVWGLFSSMERPANAAPSEDDSVEACVGNFAVFRMLSAPEYDWLERAFAAAGEAPWADGYAKPGGAGESCAADQECQTGRCLRATTTSFCTQACTAAECPANMECTGPDGDAWCVPAQVAGTGATSSGCNAASATESNSSWLTWGLVVLVSLKRRARSARLQFWIRRHMMNHLSVRRSFVLFQLLLAVPMIVVGCSEDDAQPEPTSNASAGEAGMNAGGAPNVALCGTKSDVSECDPVSAAGCDVATGATCDHSMMLGGFTCFPDSLAKAGEFCDNVNAFCGAGTACNGLLEVCQRYCCADTECTEGACERHIFDDGAADVGVCTAEFGGRCAFDLGGAGGACPDASGGGQGGGSEGGAPALGGASAGGAGGAG